LGRLLLAALFVLSAVAKIALFDETRRAIDALGISAAGALLPIAIAAELIGGVMVAIGFEVRRASLGLLAYLALATLFFYHDLSIGLHRAFALSNLAFAGGLLMLYAHGAGAFSVERYLARRRR